jgi:hypothetical protein
MCPSYGHPEGQSRRPWFRFVGDWGFRAEGHPEGPSTAPCLRIADGRVYPTFALPADDGACFEIVGSFVYLAGSLGAPWFEVVTTQHTLHPSLG